MEYNYYFPFIINSPNSSLEIGAQSYVQDTTHYIPGIPIQLPIYWNQIEIEPSVYSWDEDTDIAVKNFRNAGCKTMGLGIKNTPEFYRLYDGVCSPPTRECFPMYSKFVMKCIERYKPEYIAVWNEPDAPRWMDTWYLGCFGDDTEGGLYYSELLNLVHFYVKRDYPDVKVVAGELKLDKIPSDFWIAVNNYGFYDVASYHVYVQKDNWDKLIEHTDWMAANIKEDKELWITETSMQYEEPSEELEQLQASYLDYVIRTVRPKVDRVLWFTLANNGWEHTDLVENNTRKPSWYRLRSYVETGI